MGDGVDTPQTVMTTRAPAVLKIFYLQSWSVVGKYREGIKVDWDQEQLGAMGV